MYRLIAFVLLCLTITSANAGSLFPPKGLDQGESCPTNHALTWIGDGLECTPVTMSLTLSCPSGQLLTGISNNQPVCKSVVLNNCAYKNAISGQKYTICPSGKVQVGMGYEGETWNNQPDNHRYPETDKVYCCNLSIQ